MERAHLAGPSSFHPMISNYVNFTLISICALQSSGSPCPAGLSLRIRIHIVQARALKEGHLLLTVASYIPELSTTVHFRPLWLIVTSRSDIFSNSKLQHHFRPCSTSIVPPSPFKLLAQTPDQLHLSSSCLSNSSHSSSSRFNAALDTEHGMRHLGGTLFCALNNYPPRVEEIMMIWALNLCVDSGRRGVHLDGDRGHIGIEDSSVILVDMSVMAGWTTNSRTVTEKMEGAIGLWTEFFDSFEGVANRPVVCYINLVSDIVVLFSSFWAASWTRSMLQHRRIAGRPRRPRPRAISNPCLDCDWWRVRMK